MIIEQTFYKKIKKYNNLINKFEIIMDFFLSSTLTKFYAFDTGCMFHLS